MVPGMVVRMRITCVGGGPAGLYFAMVAKLRDPAREVVVVERNPPGTTYGWGVVYWDSLRHALHRVDAPSAREITARSVTWTGQQLRMGERVVHLGGYGYSIERRQLLDVLQARARQLGVQMRFEETVDDAADVDADVVVAADGHMSALRSRRAEVFGTSIRTGANAYIWLGTSKEFKDFTFGCEPRTPAGSGTTATSSPNASTVIVECADATRRGLGLDALDDSAGLEMLADVFRAAPRRRALPTAGRASTRPGGRISPTLTNERWYDDRLVLLGDAAHTAHYSIGSGTRLALEDAIALGNALSHPASTWRAPCVATPMTPARGSAVASGGGGERVVVRVDGRAPHARVDGRRARSAPPSAHGRRGGIRRHRPVGLGLPPAPRHREPGAPASPVAARRRPAAARGGPTR